MSKMILEQNSSNTHPLVVLELRSFLNGQLQEVKIGRV
jgi:hypothetical protein